mgnify:CR=1 FL=1
MNSGASVVLHPLGLETSTLQTCYHLLLLLRWGGGVKNGVGLYVNQDAFQSQYPSLANDQHSTQKSQKLTGTLFGRRVLCKHGQYVTYFHFHQYDLKCTHTDTLLHTLPQTVQWQLLSLSRGGDWTAQPCYSRLFLHPPLPACKISDPPMAWWKKIGMHSKYTPLCRAARKLLSSACFLSRFSHKVLVVKPYID